MTKSKWIMGLTMWVCVVMFYLYQYILRVSPGVMANDMMADMAIDASSFGLLSSLATYSYAVLQIPAGILSDLYGTRRMVLWSLLLCISGLALFTLTDWLVFAFLGRIMIGAGSACAFLCVCKVASDWFPENKKAMFFALTITIGTIGALMGGKPLAHASADFGWKAVLQAIAIFGAIIFIGNFIFLKDKNDPENRNAFDLDELKQSIIAVFTNKTCWVYSLIATGIYLCISVFADLWGVSFMIVKLGIDAPKAAELISILYIGTCIGCLLMATFIQYLNRQLTLLIGAIGVFIVMSGVIFIPNLTVLEASVLLFLAGLLAGTEVLCFAAACDAMPTSVAATVTGFLNFIVTLGAAILQMEVGMVLSWGQESEDVLTYSVIDYQWALVSTIAGIFLSIFLILLYRKDDSAR